MRRPQRYNQLYILGAGLKRERPDLMQEWQVTSVTSPSIAQGEDNETSLHLCAQGKQAMRRPHATISLILEALVSRESNDHSNAMQERPSQRQDNNVDTTTTTMMIATIVIVATVAAITDA